MKKTLSNKRVTWSPTVVNNNTLSTHKIKPKKNFSFEHNHILPFNYRFLVN